ncbi:MAG: sortase, partial [Propionicimonas sp.]
NQIDKLKLGDVVLIETRDYYFVYRVSASEVVAPSKTSVLLPVPNDRQAAPTKAMLTMTSCHPEFSARERFVVYAVLDVKYPHAQGVPASVLEVQG